ncbi:MAG: DUF2017 domain-containing protein [Nocardioides sp.]
MTTGFAWHRRSDLVIANFSILEADLLRSLAAQLVELLRNEQALPDEVQDPLEAMFNFTGPLTAPDDPVLARLLPSAYSDNDEASAEFRRFTEPALRGSKAFSAESVVSALAEAGLPEVGREHVVDASAVIDVELTTQVATLWLRSLTDMRLALATRLGVAQDDEDFWHTLPEEDPRSHAYNIYQWLGYLQETLVEALSH